MDYRERGSHAQSVYPTQDTSRIETVRLKGEEKTDTSVVVVSARNMKKGTLSRRRTLPNKA